jgi:hypothetical protein
VAPDQERQRQQEAPASSLYSSLFDYTPIREQRVAGILADPANRNELLFIEQEFTKYCKQASTRALFPEMDFIPKESGIGEIHVKRHSILYPISRRLRRG